MLLRSLLHSVATGALIASTVAVGLFDAVSTDDGFDNYAERPWRFLRKYLPWITKVPMPANISVNIGYVVVAVYWILTTKKNHSNNRFTDHQAYMFYVFAWVSLLYAPIQFTRIITQNHRFAILDQWYTLPIFSWVIVWACYIINGWNPATILSVVTVSSSSYCFTLLKIAGHEDKGFEISLAVHILFAVVSGIRVLKMYPTRPALLAFGMGIFCCMAFVCLKVLDKPLGKVDPFFQILSGHFWSKIADFLQIHYVFLFFFHITSSMNEKTR